MKNQQKKPKALITGASGGIGHEMAKVMAEHGHDLVLVARNTEKMQHLKEDILKENHVDVTIIAMDLAVHDAAEKLYNEVTQQGHSIGMLVNNAGFADYGFFHEREWKKEEQMITLNITTLTHLTKLFVRDMVKAGSGHVLNVASTAAFIPGPFMAVYFATKAYVLSFSEAISNELGGTGVYVTALCPGPTESGFQERAEMTFSKAVSGNKIPTSREVAEFAYKEMLRKKTIAIHGWKNRLQVFSARLTPRKLTVMIVRKLFENSQA